MNNQAAFSPGKSRWVALTQVELGTSWELPRTSRFEGIAEVRFRYVKNLLNG